MKVKYATPYYVGFDLIEFIAAINTITSPKQMTVKKIEHATANNFVLHHHYLHRKIYIARNVSYGLYANDYLVGVCMFGFPVWTTYPGLCPPHTPSECPELIRLATVSNLPKNTESYFIGQCIKMLLNDWHIETGQKPALITSFCDNALGFGGAIYRATNFALHRVTHGRPSNPGSRHGKWGGNDDQQDAQKTLYVYYYNRNILKKNCEVSS